MLSKNLQKIIDDYKNDLRIFIEKHDLNHNILDDIDDRIWEKISEIKNPKTVDIMRILAEIGEPEEIFADEIKTEKHNIIQQEKTQNSINSFFLILWSSIRKIFENLWKPFEKVKFLWVFQIMETYTNIPASVFRVIFLLVLVFALSISQRHEGLFIILIFSYIFSFLVLWTRFFAIIFAGGMTMGFLLALIVAICIFGMYITNYHLESIYIFEGVSSLFPIGMIIGIFSLALFFYYFLYYIFYKKWLKSGFFITALLGIIVAICMGIIVCITYVGQIEWKEVEREFVLDVPDNNFMSLTTGYIETGARYNIGLWNMSRSGWVDIKPSPDDKIHIFVKEQTVWIWVREDAIQFQNVTINKEGIIQAKFAINPEWKFPLTRKNVYITRVFLPKNVRFFHGGGSILNQWMFFDEMEKYSLEEQEIILNNCGLYMYTDDNQLKCSLSKASIEKLLKNYR